MLIPIKQNQISKIVAKNFLKLKKKDKIKTFKCIICGSKNLRFATSVFSIEYSPAVNKNYPDKLLWGDTHLHTNESADAWSIGNPNLTPSDAFRFARGEEVTSESGVKAKLRVPLDFLMVSDHATYLGVFKRIKGGDKNLIERPLGKRWKNYIHAST